MAASTLLRVVDIDARTLTPATTASVRRGMALAARYCRCERVASDLSCDVRFDSAGVTCADLRVRVAGCD